MNGSDNDLRMKNALGDEWRATLSQNDGHRTEIAMPAIPMLAFDVDDAIDSNVGPTLPVKLNTSKTSQKRVKPSTTGVLNPNFQSGKCQMCGNNYMNLEGHFNQR